MPSNTIILTEFIEHNIAKLNSIVNPTHFSTYFYFAFGLYPKCLISIEAVSHTYKLHIWLFIKVDPFIIFLSNSLCANVSGWLIDLTCKLIAPVVTRYIISFVSLKASVLTLALWNIISVWDEDNTDVIEGSLMSKNTKFVWNSWRVYLKQNVVLPGIARALLFFSVPSFGTLMIAALEWQGITAFVIGIAHKFSAAIGIVATLLYPILESHFSTPSIDLWSIWSQWTFLLVCVASIWVQNHLLSAYMLMGGVALSRLGSWTFDLSLIQQMQDHKDRCVVGGVHKSLQSCMDLMGYVMRVAIADPQDFWKLILISFGAVMMVAFLYTTRKPTSELVS
ncbi:hypothetical protein UlMin_000878 [Ulmus minor]